MLWGSRTGGGAGQHGLLVEADKVPLLERRLALGPGVPFAKVSRGALECNPVLPEQDGTALRACDSNPGRGLSSTLRNRHGGSGHRGLLHAPDWSRKDKNLLLDLPVS